MYRYDVVVQIERIHDDLGFAGYHTGVPASQYASREGYVHLTVDVDVRVPEHGDGLEGLSLGHLSDVPSAVDGLSDRQTAGVAGPHVLPVGVVSYVDMGVGVRLALESCTEHGSADVADAVTGGTYNDIGIGGIIAGIGLLIVSVCGTSIHGTVDGSVGDPDDLVAQDGYVSGLSLASAVDGAVQ